MRQNDVTNLNEKSLTASKTPYLYEVVFALWIQSWTSLAASIESNSQIYGTSNTIPRWPYELIKGSYNSTSDSAVALSFIRNMSFFLPLCMKSLGLRCAQIDTSKLNVAMTFLDDNHIQIFIAVFETIALGLMRQALSGNNRNANSDKMLTRALMDGDCVMEFLIGAFAFLHPTQVSTLIHSYFNIFEACEDKSCIPPEDAKKSHHRLIKCARQLRLHAVERLAAMPAFSKLNFPVKFTGFSPRMKSAPSSWTNQSAGNGLNEDLVQKNWDKVDHFPQCFWLSDLLMNQCLSICNRSLKTIIKEAKQQEKTAKRGRRKGHSVLLRDDLIRMESLAFHSILTAFELLIKRQAMDSRFQTVSSNSRVAALFTSAVVRQSVNAVSILARMDPNKRVRVTWLLALLYILQEGPDAIIRDELRKLSKVSLEHVSRDASFPACSRWSHVPPFG